MIFLDHFWQGLDQIVLPDAPKSVAAITLKIVLDQLLFAPLFLIVFWYVLKLLEGRPEEAYGMCAEKLYPTLLVSYMVWPGAHPQMVCCSCCLVL